MEKIFVATLKMAENLEPGTRATQAEAEIRLLPTRSASGVVEVVLGGGE